MVLLGHLHSGVAVVMVVNKCKGKGKEMRVREKGEWEKIEVDEEEEEEEEEGSGEKQRQSSESRVNSIIDSTCRTRSSKLHFKFPLVWELDWNNILAHIHAYCMHVALRGSVSSVIDRFRQPQNCTCKYNQILYIQTSFCVVCPAAYKQVFVCLFVCLFVCF